MFIFLVFYLSFYLRKVCAKLCASRNEQGFFCLVLPFQILHLRTRRFVLFTITDERFALVQRVFIELSERQDRPGIVTVVAEIFDHFLDAVNG